MASAAEQLASNMSLGAFGKAKELQKRILFTLFILIIYRIGTYIPVPGVNVDAVSDILNASGANTPDGQGTGGGLLSRMNMFAGGAIERMAIFALNVMPYITASIIMTLMKGSVGSLKELDKDGEQGRKQINQYTRYLTVFFAAFQAFGIARLLESQNLVYNPGLFFEATAVITLVGGTMFLMWLGEQITARGIGNGVSLIILAGIIAELPNAIFYTLNLQREGSLSSTLIMLVLIVAIGLTLLIVYVERAQRRLLVQYPKRQVAGGKMFGGDSSFLPLKLNAAGVIPPIFASALLMLPATAGAYFVTSGPGWVRRMLTFIGYGQPAYFVLYGALIVFFCFFYVPYVFKPEDTADNLRQHGGFLPGIRPGARTAEYMSYVLNRLTFIGAIYVAFVCILPAYIVAQNGSIPPSVQILIGGMSLLIIVSVTLDTVAQIQSHLVAHQYEGLIKKSRMGRRRGK